MAKMILIAHDDPVQAHACANLLQVEGGYASEVIDDMEQVVEAVRRLRPSLLILSDGFGYGSAYFERDIFDVAAEIRKDPEWTGLPIAMFCHMDKERDRARELGCVPFLCRATRAN